MRIYIKLPSTTCPLNDMCNIFVIVIYPQIAPSNIIKTKLTFEMTLWVMSYPFTPLPNFASTPPNCVNTRHEPDSITNYRMTVDL